MNPSFKFILPLVATAGILLAFSPAVLEAAPDNTAVGYQALFRNTTGSDNVVEGYRALFSNTNGAKNTASGYQALYSNTSGELNVAMGFQALYYNTTGLENVAVGDAALGGNTTGEENTAVGSGAGGSGTSGFANTSIGAGAGVRVGSWNTAIGDGAMLEGNGNMNLAIGAYALSDSTGNNNIALGYYAGIKLATGSNDIYIGTEGVGAVFGGPADESNTIRLGDPAKQTATYIAGINGVNVASTAEYVVVNADGRLGTKASSITSINPLKLNATLARLEEQNTKLEATVAKQEKDFQTTLTKQQQEITDLTASLKEQASLLQKVSAQVAINRPAPQMVSNNN